MAYRIEGLAPAAFESLFGMMDGELAARGAMRVTADAPRGYPCRVSLRDADEGEELILLNHVSHDVDGPFCTTYAIYVRKDAEAPASYEDEAPPYLDSRTLSLRGFGADGLLKHGLLAQPGEADAKIREMFERPEVDTIHAHAATYGCFLARIERN
ncbi:DUF1203 domain-containing protein [Allosphingosinicella sp.]|uniref:DUF1203 domain-containing protein n=1 Tax=Allosphingosinicella sp. TaxID=2823234 RepID=UPI003783241F